MEKFPCSVLVFDTRSFTDNLKKYDLKGDNSFLLLIRALCQNGLHLAQQISDGQDFYFNSTGDGFICIFFGSDSSIRNYLFSLQLNIINKKACMEFNKSSGDQITFGMGLETGTVQLLEMSSSSMDIRTFIGNVINIAARIESETKSHARAEIILGPNINNEISLKLFKYNYNDAIEQVKLGSLEDNAIVLINKMNEINQKMFLSYIFEHRLKGVDNPVPLFRVSPTLANENNPDFSAFISKLSEILISRNLV